MSDPYETSKSRVWAEIEAIKRGPNPLEKLREMQARMHQLWSGSVADFIQAQDIVFGIAEKLGVECGLDRRDALYFPNWVMEQIRTAIEEFEHEPT